MNLDHDYASLQSPRSAPLQTPRSTSPIPGPSSPSSRPLTPSKDIHHNNAINNNVQDFTLKPGKHEQYDLLVFFANIKQNIEQVLISRLKKHAIKWYVSVQVELIKEGDSDQQTSSPHFRSRTYSALNLETVDMEDIDAGFQKMFESFSKYLRESSGWVLKRVLHLTVHTVKYSPTSGSSFMELPKPLRRINHLLNIRNLDQKCFLWCCLASINSLDSPLVTDNEPFEHEINMNGLTYPVTINQITKVENQNPFLSVNIYVFEEKDILPIRITKCKNRLHRVDLLLLKSENSSHYVLIKDINKFLTHFFKE